jgi:type IV pilus assembly protein PilX
MRASNDRRYRSAAQRHATGAVLIVALVLLLVLTILGISGVQNTTLEERMTGNYRDRTAAFQAAEAALRRGEEDIASLATLTAMKFDGTDGTYELDKSVGSLDPTDVGNYARSVTIGTLSGVASPPEYFIEKLPKIPLPNSSLVVGFQSAPVDIQYYRVSARGVGISNKAEVVLQSVYHR